jgi:hypothetical protein
MTKDKLEHEMFFVRGVLPSLLDEEKRTPPSPFARRYGIYFQKQPPAFPPCLLRGNVERRDAPFDIPNLINDPKSPRVNTL